MANRSWARLPLPDALPAPAGRWARIYVSGWLVLLAVFLVGTVGEIEARLRQGAASAYSWAPLGIDLAGDDKDPYRIGFVTPDAVRAGVRIGDRVLAVRDVPVDAASDDAVAARRIRILTRALEGQMVRVRISRVGAPPRDVTLQHRASEARILYAHTGLTPTALTYASTVAFLLSSLILFAGALVLFGRRREPVGALLSLGLLALAAMMGNQGAVWDQWGMHGVFLVCDILGFVALYLSVLIFPDGRFFPRWTKALALAYPGIALLVMLTDRGGWLVAIAAVAALVAMIVRYRREAPTARLQWKWAMIGFALGFAFLAGAVALYTPYVDAHYTNYPVILWSWIVSPSLLATTAALIVGGVVLSVLRFRLYDTPAAISRSLVYAVLTLTIVAVFAGSEKIIEVIGEHYLGEEAGALSAGIAAAVAAATISPLHHRLSHWAEHWLRRDLLALQHHLPSLLLEAGESGDEADVAAVLIEEVSHILHSVRSAVISDDEVLASSGGSAERPSPRSSDHGAPLAIVRTDAAFPVHLRLGHRGTRWLLLGPRPDGTLYDKDEREVLSSLAAPAGQALAKARHTAEIAARIEALTKEVEALKGAR